MDLLTEQKARFRKDISSKRDALSFHERELKNSALQHRLLNLPAIRSAQTIFIYVSFRNEAATQAIISAALDGGKIVAVPFTDMKNKRLIPSRIFSLREDLAPGAMGILEPRPDKIIPIRTESIDVVITPGVAFSELGWRLGYGGGFYDKFFKEFPKISYALAFEVQIVPAVPFDDRYDMQVDNIVTEERVICCK
ncbi:MAG: 5-formyltetrahydrofolate cyclo-ligase [Pseudomonadota bacterium]